MGKAAVDLPDPLQTPPDTQARTSTDDLLAQLAGEEIDRLLSEADAEDGAAPAPVAPQDTAAEAVPSHEPVAAKPAGVEDGDAPGSRADALDVNAELDVLFSAAIAKDAAPAAGAAAAADPGLTAETTAAERAGLSSSPAAPAAASSSDGPLPLLLRPLEWLSAPLSAFPDSVRDVIGKVAIITAVNAAAVLAYVLLFRRG